MDGSLDTSSILVGSTKTKRRMYPILRLFFIQVADMAYHHALACISSALTSISRQSEYLITEGVFFAT